MVTPISATTLPSPWDTMLFLRTTLHHHHADWTRKVGGGGGHHKALQSVGERAYMDLGTGHFSESFKGYAGISPPE